VISRTLRIVLVLKTAEGGLWTVPQVEELRRRGHHVVAVLPPGKRLREEFARRDVQVVDSAFAFRFRPSIRTVRGLWRLRQQVRSLRPDVVHYHLYASALAARLCTVGLRLRRVHMVAGPLYLESTVIRLFERALTRLDHVTIGGSAFTSDSYRALGLSAKRTPAIPYGVDTGDFVPPSPDERSRARADLGVTADTFVAIMVAYVYAPKRSVHRGRGIKGHDVLLEAWKSFSPWHPTARLVIVGAGFDERGDAHREVLLDRYEVARDASVVWLPSVPDVRSFYAAADVSVSPSLSENHGAAVEAAAMGVPCIVSDAGALPETVDESSGWVVPRADVGALVDALESAHLEFEARVLADRGAHGRDRTVRLFDRREAAARVADVIETVANAEVGGRR
jgi:glycosyltransferase involved in cell wall biosynthesis